MDALAMGTILANLENQKGSLQPYKSSFVKMFLVVGFLLIISWTFVMGKRLDLIQVFKLTLIGGCYFSLIGVLVSSNGNNFFNRMFNFGFLKFSGKISYGLYVFHPLMFSICESNLKANVFVNLFISFLATYVVASLSFYLFEQRILQQKKYFEYSSKPGVLVKSYEKT
jgi:peptidoglycan/LPS O-acetylase OafA/YrhL